MVRIFIYRRTLPLASNDEIINEIMNTRCNVLSDNNRFLFFGKVVYFDRINQKIRVEDFYHSDLRMCFYPDTPIKLFATSNENSNEFVLVEGGVSLSMDTYLQITPIHILKKEESRHYFRQNAMEPSLVSFVNQKAAGHPCKIINISGSGIAIQSKSIYEVGDQLWFYNQKFCKRGVVHNIKCQVVRKQILENHQYFYGCQFIDMKLDEEENLFHDIFALQAADRRARQ